MREDSAGFCIAFWEKLSDAAISAGWNFDEAPIELDNDDSSEPRGDRHDPFRFEDKVLCKRQFRSHPHL
jgi:hypothetical protein